MPLRLCIQPGVNQLVFSSAQKTIRLSAQETEGSPQKLLPAVILLHGSGGNLDFWMARFGPLLLQSGIALYAPHYFDRTGTTRADLTTIQDGVHVPQWLATVDDAIRFVATRPGVDPERLVLAGISLGAFLALACGARFSSGTDPGERRRIRAIVELSGGLVAPFAEQATPTFPPTLILHGADDTIVPASFATALDARLTELEVAHRTEILAGETHWFSPNSMPRLLHATSGFLAEHLRLGAEITPAM